MSNTYNIQEFGKLIGKSTKTLQKWDRDGILKAHRAPTNRRFYTHEDYENYMKGAKRDATLHKDQT